MTELLLEGRSRQQIVWEWLKQGAESNLLRIKKKVRISILLLKPKSDLLKRGLLHTIRNNQTKWPREMPPPTDNYSEDSSDGYSDDDFESEHGGSPAKEGVMGGEGKEGEEEKGEIGGHRGEEEKGGEAMEGGGWLSIDFEEDITLLDQIGGGGVGLIYNGG